MPTKTGAIRSMIGPIKGNLIKNRIEAKSLLEQEIPESHDDKRTYSRKLRDMWERLHAATQRLQAKHDQWGTMVETVAQDELDHFEASCEEIMNLILDCEELLISITSRCDNIQEDLEQATPVLSTSSVPAVAKVPQTANPAVPSGVSSDTKFRHQSGHSGVTSRHRPPSVDLLGDDVEPSENGDQAARGGHTAGSTQQVGFTMKPSAFKAPKIKLPTFSGNYMEFRQFDSIFDANIHRRADLTPTEKFTYLLSLLEGDARNAIAGLVVNDDNYEVALDLLKSRFDRADERLVTMLYSEFMRIPVSTRKVEDKQRTLDECERIFRQLESAGETVNSNKSLVFGLLGKFPISMIKDLQRYHSIGANNSLDEVRKGLRKTIFEEEATEGIISDLQSLKVGKDGKPGNSTEKPAGDERQHQPRYESRSGPGEPGKVFLNSSLAAAEKRPPKRGPQLIEPPRACYFCNGDHFNGKCTSFPSARSRIRRLGEVARCQRCARKHPRHLPQCLTDLRCVYCRTDGDHISTLCHVRFPDISQPPPRQAFGSGSGFQSGSSAAPPPSRQAPSHDSSSNAVSVAAVNNAAVKRAVFLTAKTDIVNPHTGARCRVRLGLDTFSSRSYINDHVASKLGLFGHGSDKLYVDVFGTDKVVEFPTTRVEFDVVLRDGNRKTVEANTTRMICQTDAVVNSWSDRERNVLKCFSGSLADDPFDINGKIDVLIGASLIFDFVQGPRMSSPLPGLFLVPTSLGLMLTGEAEQDPGGRSNSTIMSLCVMESPCRYPNELGLVSAESKFQASYPDIDEYWALEKIGITDDPIENDDDKALENFAATVQFEDGRYQVTLPWIEEKRAMLPSNYEIAYDRLRYLVRRLKSNPDLLQGYRDILQLQIDRGIIEEVPKDEYTTTNTTHYLPHHTVIKSASNTTKVRIVYDAASKKNRKAVSLNQCLLRGPVILPNLCQLLIRMRTYETVVISDIEKAFLQVGLQTQDRDVTRFLWFQDDTDLKLCDNIKVFRFTRVNFGVISSPFLLAATLQHHLTQENTDFAESLRDDIYVDNFVSGVARNSNPIDYYHKLKSLCDRAGMNVQEFCSNSQVLMNAIPDRDRVQNTDVKVLGVGWDSMNGDTLRLLPSKKLEQYQQLTTKRSILQTIASIFDPLGFFQPVLLPAKCFLQKMWELKFDWDTQLPDWAIEEWRGLGGSLCAIFQHRIPRFIGSTNDSECTFAVFSDASAKAYATAVYLRVRQGPDTWVANLIYAKSRLAPSSGKRKRTGDRVTLPRLELLGAVIGTRAGEFCRKGLGLPGAKIHFFIDSQCVLHWIVTRGLLKRFVANRVEEIRKISNCEFRYVKSADNPADQGTRGKSADELLGSSQWWNGPRWLTRNDGHWPESSVPPMSDEMISELQSESKPAYFSHALVVTDQEDVDRKTGFLGINAEEYSSLQRLLRVSAICVKFLKGILWNKLSTATKQRHAGLTAFFDELTEGTTTANEYEATKTQWIKVIQCSHYPDVIDALRDEAGIRGKPPQIIKQLGLQLDNGLIRSHGRFEHAELPDTAKYPILMPKACRFTELIVIDTHQQSMHSGVSHTLSQIRLKFWIPHGRVLVRSILKRCLVCTRYKTAMPFRLPPMPPWPKERVSQCHPFQTTGLDYFGPVTVKVGASKQKMWVCLFTCLATRAVHLEPVMDFSAKEFLHCLIRFVSRRGVPNKIISDNASQFQLVKILGDAAWKRTPKDESVTSYSASNGINWKFITELAPWQGGYYERLVGLVKSTLRTSIRQKLLTWTDLVTLLTEAEAVVNSRPLTYVSDDVNSRFRVIRPCDFLSVVTAGLGDSPDGSEVQPGKFGEAGKRLVSVWKQRCRALEKLWKIWHEDYLMSLRERRKISHKAGRSDVDKEPLVGQVVLVCDSDAPRGRWKLARLTQLIRSSDGRVRAAELVLPNGVSLKRPLNLLVPLEVEAPSKQNSLPIDNVKASEVPINHVGPNSEVQDISDADDGPFYGFDEEDVVRTIEAIRRFDVPSVGGAPQTD